MKILKLYSLFILFIAIGVSCQSEKPSEEKSDPIDSVFQAGDDTLFRGSNIGDSPDHVRNSEKSRIVEDSDTLLHYQSTYTFESGLSDVEVYYTFDEFGLFEIQVDFYPRNEEAPSKLMAQLENYMTTRFGDPKELGTAKRWTTNSTTNSLVEITLSNESADAEEPFVSLNFLEPLPDEI